MISLNTAMQKKNNPVHCCILCIFFVCLFCKTQQLMTTIFCVTTGDPTHLVNLLLRHQYPVALLCHQDHDCLLVSVTMHYRCDLN